MYVETYREGVWKQVNPHLHMYPSCPFDSSPAYTHAIHLIVIVVQHSPLTQFYIYSHMLRVHALAILWFVMRLLHNNLADFAE